MWRLHSSRNSFVQSTQSILRAFLHRARRETRLWHLGSSSGCHRYWFLVIDVQQEGIRHWLIILITFVT